MKGLQWIGLFSGLLLLTACSQNDPMPTTVDGTIVNYYTHQPISNLAIEVISYDSNWSNSVNSVAQGQTDNDGHYSLHFDGSWKKEYIIRYSGQELFDKTSNHASDGVSIEAGKANTVNYQLTPPVTVQLDIDASKNGGNLLQAYFLTNDRLGNDRLGNDFSGTIIYDTFRIKPQITGRYPFALVPDRAYQFIIGRGTVVRDGPYNSRVINNSYEYHLRFIGNNDTSIIRIR